MSRHCLADCIVQSSKQSVHKLAAQSVPQSKAYNGYLCLHVAVPLANPEVWKRKGTECGLRRLWLHSLCKGAPGQPSVSGSFSSHLHEPGRKSQLRNERADF